MCNCYKLAKAQVTGSGLELNHSHVLEVNRDEYSHTLSLPNSKNKLKFIKKSTLEAQTTYQVEKAITVLVDVVCRQVYVSIYNHISYFASQTCIVYCVSMIWERKQASLI